MVEPEYITTQIKQALGEGTHVEVIDLTGSRDHYKVIVMSPMFEGKLRLKRHRLIHAALAEVLKGPLHALTIEDYTPAQWQAQHS